MGRPTRPPLRFEDLPLFASDEQIAEACVGPDPERIRKWIIGTPGLEACGFPKKVPLYAARYTPAVRRFYDAEFMPPVQGRYEERDTWNDRTSRRRA